MFRRQTCQLRARCPAGTNSMETMTVVSAGWKHKQLLTHRRQTEVTREREASARLADMTAAGPIATQRGRPSPGGSPCSCSSSVTSDATAPVASREYWRSSSMRSFERAKHEPNYCATPTMPPRLRPVMMRTFE